MKRKKSSWCLKEVLKLSLNLYFRIFCLLLGLAQCYIIQSDTQTVLYKFPLLYLQLVKKNVDCSRKICAGSIKLHLNLKVPFYVQLYLSNRYVGYRRNRKYFPTNLNIATSENDIRTCCQYALDGFTIFCKMLQSVLHLPSFLPLCQAQTEGQEFCSCLFPRCNHLAPFHPK